MFAGCVTRLTDDFDDIDNDGVQECIRLTDIGKESCGVGKDELHPRDLLATQDTESTVESTSVGWHFDKIAPF